ncbi:OLC1v1032712C1 [Oldenlandia corymbosa var. corymbosa]|uniref:OLC1v1032712C1 n=1 Tax=Oldenlandia corymbosa var. corymbosa TaxID=529605 RepID=A0AAV1CLP5_OLDCO|nr:OLC1v1032712C1 [Oldenlandia corymbosa var. corymbosa]
MEVKQVLRMNGGDSHISYAENSAHEMLILLKVKTILQNSMEYLFSRTQTECARVADLGCSSGPNTLQSILGIIQSMDNSLSRNITNDADHQKQPIVVQVFLNDLYGNDFNTVPAGLVSESGSHLNETSIYVEKGGNPKVQQAYLDQFRKDFTMFLKHRYEELVPNGQLFATIVGKNDDETDGPHAMNIIGSALNDMVLELPLDASVPQEHLKNGGDFNVRAAHVSSFIRAVFEPILESHFGDAIMNQLFQRFATKTAKLLEVGKGIVHTVVISLAKEEKNM